MQRGMAERDPDVPADERIEFRIGINLGDIIIEDADIFGDGVNVAARLEALAESGGICISWVVRAQIGNKLPYPFVDMGEHSVKNIARPVRAYAMSAIAVTSTRLVPARAPPRPAPRSAIPARAVIAATLVTVVGTGIGAWWAWPHAGVTGIQSGRRANSQSTPAVTGGATKPAPRLSIVVLPFSNLSNDPEQEYLPMASPTT